MKIYSTLEEAADDIRLIGAELFEFDNSKIDSTDLIMENLDWVDFELQKIRRVGHFSDGRSILSELLSELILNVKQHARQTKCAFERGIGNNGAIFGTWQEDNFFGDEQIAYLLQGKNVPSTKPLWEIGGAGTRILVRNSSGLYINPNKHLIYVTRLF